MDILTIPPSSSPSKTLQKQWLEALGTLHYVLAFTVLDPFSCILLFFLLFTQLWSLTVLCLIWLYWTGTPLAKGEDVGNGQRCGECGNTKGIISLLSVMCTAPFCNFLTKGNNFSQHFPGLQTWTATLTGLFYFPVFRDYIMLRLLAVSHHSLDFALSAPKLGQAVLIFPGDAQEALYMAPGQHCLKLLNRKGFIRLALRHRASLVPTYSFGENDIFKTKTFAEGSWQFLCQVIVKSILGFSPCIFWGHSLFSPNSWDLLPLCRAITTVVSTSIPVAQFCTPTEEQVDHYHRLYMEALERLLEEHKESCGVPASTHLAFC